MFYTGSVLWLWRPFYRHCCCNFGDVLSVFVVYTRKPLLKGNLKKSSTLSQRKVKVRSIFLILIWITVQLEAVYVSSPSIHFPSIFLFLWNIYTISLHCRLKKNSAVGNFEKRKVLLERKLLLTVISLAPVEYETIDTQRGATRSYPAKRYALISNKREWNNCFIKNAPKT